MNNKNPKCCDKEASWIDMGPKLQYYFCKECRKEVKKEEETKPIELDNIEWGQYGFTVRYF